MNNFSKLTFSLFCRHSLSCLSLIVFIFSSGIKAQNTVINSNGSKEFVIDNIFQSVQNPDLIKAFYYRFSASSKHYALVFNNRVTLAILDKELYVTTRDVIANTSPQQGNILSKYTISSNAAYIYFVYEILPEKMISVQMIETDNNGNYLTSTPIYTMTTHSFNDTATQNKLKIDNVNDSSSLTIQQMAYYTHPKVSRDKRDIQFSQLECLVPVLAIANQFMNSPCDIVKNSLTYVFGDNNSGTNNNNSSTVQTSDLSWELTDYIFTGEKDAYAGYAASQSCEVPLQTIFSSRNPRSPEGADCVYDTMDILTPYLIITGYDFDRAHFEQTINNILSTGASGINAAHSQELEDELVVAVQNVRTQTNQVTINFSQELHQAANLNGSTVSFQSLVAGESIYDNIPTIATIPTAVNTPTDQIAIGNYELNLSGTTLSNFRQNYPQITPRNYNQNQWVNSNVSFTTEIIENPTTAQINELRSIINQWYPTDSSSSSSDSDSDDETPIVYEGYINSSSLLRTGRSLASGLVDELDEENPNSVMIIIRYQNAPSSLLFGYVNNESREATVAYALSNPNNIRTPYSSTAIRGGRTTGLATVYRILH